MSLATSVRKIVAEEMRRASRESAKASTRRALTACTCSRCSRDRDIKPAKGVQRP